MSSVTTIFIMWVTFVGLICASSSSSLSANTEKSINKRDLIPVYGDEYPTITAALAATKISSAYPLSLGPWISGHRGLAPSPAAVANAIAAAKQASANVLIAQQQVQAAKEHVLNQQRIAMDKETAATIQAQKSEAATAVQRSEAAAAAQAVVLAQQRFAAAKGAVAHRQRIAAAKEAEAATALQSAAHAAAAEIQKTEIEAARLANLQRSGAAAAAHHVSATKDAVLAPLTSGNNHVPTLSLAWPTGSYVGGGVAATSAVNPWAGSGSAPGAVTSYYTPASKLYWH